MKRGQTQKYFRAKLRTKRTGVAGARGPRDSHHVGGTGPQGCEPGQTLLVKMWVQLQQGY